MKITLKTTSDFSPEQDKFILEAVQDCSSILNWKEWQDEVSETSFSETNQSGKTILAKMAAEEIVISLKRFHSLSNTIAYTYLHGTLINLNDYYLNQYLKMNTIEGYANVASTVIHEFMHEMGYTHSHFWSRSNSVPYKMQHIFYRRFMEFYSKGLADLKEVKAGMFIDLKVDFQYLPVDHV